MLKKEIAKKYHEPLQNIFNYSSTNDTEDDHKDPEIFILPPKEWKNKEPGDLLSPSPETSPVKIPNQPNIISCYQKNTSFSMNDLDLIHKKPNVVNDVEATFIFPVKSESTMSLYRLNVERDLDQMAMTPSRSETDVNGDSGFGSGAQSTNPVWSGFLCRKPSDPFWNIRKPSTHTPAAVTPTRNYPGVLHPRMRKIPWISAWKKLDENSNRNERNQEINTQKSENSLNWTENMVYEGKQSNEINKTCVSTIDEELSDINSPALDDPDYNLNIFAKESGVVLENAYGKIVRDDCGVQVNFYGKSVQYDIKDSANGNISPNNNPFEKIFNFDSNSKEQKTFNFPMPIINSSTNINDKLNDDLEVNSTPQIDENISQPKIDSKSEVHYENLFGTKENIFAHCEQYNDKYQPAAISEIVGQPEDNPISNVNIFCQKPTDHSYGQVKKVERKDSGNQKNSEKKQNIRYQDLNRRESDSKYTNKNIIKRRESRSRSNTRSSSDRSNQSHFNMLDNKPDITRNKDKQDGERKVEIEMKNVPSKEDLKYEYRFDKTANKIASPRNFNRLGSQSRKPVRKITDPSRWKLEQPNFKKHINGISHQPNKIPRRISSSSKTESIHDKEQPVMINCLDEQNSFSQNEAVFKGKNAYVNVERKNSDRKIVEPKDYSYGVVKGAERSNKISYNKNDIPKSKICRRDSSSKKNETKNEGLWANAVPFQDQALNCERDEENGNLPKHFIDSHPLRRSPRKSHLPRRESKSRNDRPNLQSRQKGYNNRKKSEKVDHQPQNEFTSELMNEPEEKRTLLHQEASIDSNFDDFFKYRNKCEDNFSKIQNLNSEASAERDRGLEDPFSFRKKLNGNIPSSDDAYPFEENGRLQFYANSKTEFDDNENCKQEKLAITDFL